MLVAGEHGDPFAVLGPHASRDGSVIVRAFLPGAGEVAVVADGGAFLAYPLKPIHPDGLWEGEIAGTAAAGLPPPGDGRRGTRRRHRGSVPLSLDTVRLRSPPARRGHALPRLRQARRPCGDPRRRGGRHLRRVGAQREARQRGRRLERLGRAPAPDAPPSGQRHLGALPAGRGRRRALQVRDPVQLGRAARAEERPVRVRLRARRAPHGLRRRAPRRLPVVRRRVARRARQAAGARRADERLRGASRLVASRAPESGQVTAPSTTGKLPSSSRTT